MAEHDIYLVREKSDGSFAEISGYTHKTTSAQITNAAYDALAAADPGDGSAWQGSYTSNMPMSYTGTGTLTFNTALKVPELLVEGDTTIVHTNTTTSERLSITNDGTGPALFINQIGSQPILDIQDDGYAALFIKDGGDVGIGKNDPAAKLDVDGQIRSTKSNDDDKLTSSAFYAKSANPSIALLDTGGGTGVLLSAKLGGDFGLSTMEEDGANLVQNFTVTTGGNVGIGTDAPAAPLHVSGAVDTAVYITTEANQDDGSSSTQPDASTALWFGHNYANVYRNISDHEDTLTEEEYNALDESDNGGVWQGSYEPQPPGDVDDLQSTPDWAGIVFDADNKLRITNGGDSNGLGLVIKEGLDVGIGTDEPAARLHVSDPNGGVEVLFESSSDYDMDLKLKAGTTPNIFNLSVRDQYDLLKIWPGTGGALTGIALAGSGNVGIGTRASDSTTWPGYDLDVAGDINFTGTLYQNGSVFSAGQWTDNGSDIYFDAGKVGIGTTGPASPLHVHNTGGDTVVRFARSTDNGGGSSYLLAINELSDHSAQLDMQNGGGLSKVRIETAGDSFFNGGNVGIGNANPGASLDIVNTNNMTLKGNGLSVQGGANSGSEGYSFRALDMNGNTDLFVRGDGNVGIGTTSPAAKLDISTNSTTGLKLINPLPAAVNNSNDPPAILFQANGWDTNAGSRAYSGSIGVKGGYSGAADRGNTHPVIHFDLETNEDNPDDDLSTKMVISADGKVGIGTPSPSHDLTVGDGSANVWMKLDGSLGEFQLGSSSTGGSSSKKYFSIYDGDASAHRIFIDDTGRVGIGTTSAHRDLTVAGNFRLEKTEVDGGHPALDFNSGGAADHPELNIYDKDGNAGAFILKGGNVGIGTASPVVALDMGSGAGGRTIGWGTDLGEGGRAGGSYHYSSVGTMYNSGDLYLGTGLKADTVADQFLYSYGYDAWDGDATYNPGDYVIKDGVVYEQTHGDSTTGSATNPAGASGSTWWTEESDPKAIYPETTAGIAGMKFDRSHGITYFYNASEHHHTKNGYLNMNGKVSMALHPDRVEIEGEEVLTTPAKYEYSASDTARQDDTHFYVDTDVSGVTIDGMYEVYATIDNTPEDGQRQIDVLYGKVIIGSGGSGGTKKRYVHYVRENPQPRDLYESNGITLNHDITPYLVFSGTPGSDVGAGDSAQLRLSFNSGAEKHATDIGNINWFKMKLRKTI